MIDHRKLLEILSYEPETGLFKWKETNGGRVAGRNAGVLLSNGYIQVMFDRVRYSGQRLAWFYVHGEWPEVEVDHKNCNRSDNSLSNLRLADKRQNRWNSTPTKNASSKWKGVSFDRGRKKCWKMSFTLPDGKILQKRFEDEREAAEEYMFLALEHHGEFVRFE